MADESVLRTSLRPGLLKAVAFNESHRRFGAALYEIGHVYPPGTGELPDEYEALGVVLAGQEAPAAMALWRDVATAMSLRPSSTRAPVPAGLHPARSATLSLGKTVIGVVGEIHPDVLEAFGIVAERVAVLELNLEVLLAQTPKIAIWKPTSRFPSSDLDLALVTPDDVTAEKLDKAIRQGAGALLVDLALFDVYRGQGVPDGPAAWPTACACRRRTAPSPTPTSPTVRLTRSPWRPPSSGRRCAPKTRGSAGWVRCWPAGWHGDGAHAR